MDVGDDEVRFVGETTKAASLPPISRKPIPDASQAEEVIAADERKENTAPGTIPKFLSTTRDEGAQPSPTDELDSVNPYAATKVREESSKSPPLKLLFDVSRKHLIFREGTESNYGKVYYEVVDDRDVADPKPFPGTPKDRANLDTLFRSDRFKEYVIATAYFEICPFGAMVKERVNLDG